MVAEEFPSCLTVSSRTRCTALPPPPGTLHVYDATASIPLNIQVRTATRCRAGCAHAATARGGQVHRAHNAAQHSAGCARHPLPQRWHERRGFHSQPAGAVQICHGLLICFVDLMPAWLSRAIYSYHEARGTCEGTLRMSNMRQMIVCTCCRRCRMRAPMHLGR